ncbi:MAG TPA: GHMP kinase [Chromatiaceae bacterium]|nr:GHMP kinase [Chromatiaceae bacterium]
MRITVREAIPRHVGLGSTTQLMLAVGKAVSVVKGLGLSVREIAARLGRGSVSGIGTAVFEKGGFVVDTRRRLAGNTLGEVKSLSDIPGILFHSKLPPRWCFTVIVPHARRGLRDEEEEPILEKPLPHDERLGYELYKTLLLMMIPAVIEKDPYLFGRALSRIQRLTGEYFSPAQGGTYCCEESRILAQELEEHGALAVGQSSWGPTIYGFHEDITKARRILKQLLQQAKNLGIKVEMAYVALPRNRGATIRRI